MPSSEIENEKQEVIQPAQNGEDAKVAPEKPETSQKSPADDQEKNWKEVREIMHHQRYEIEELKKQLSKKPNSSEEVDNSLNELADDDVLTVSDAKKLTSNIARQAAQEIIKDHQKKTDFDRVPNQFADYQDVIKYVDEIVKENPALEGAILNSVNPRLTAYHLVKSSYIYRRDKSKNEVSQDAQKVLDNAQKPMSSQSVGASSPLNEVGKYERMTTKKATEVRRLAEEYASRR